MRGKYLGAKHKDDDKHLSFALIWRFDMTDFVAKIYINFGIKCLLSIDVQLSTKQIIFAVLFYYPPLLCRLFVCIWIFRSNVTMGIQLFKNEEAVSPLSWCISLHYYEEKRKKIGLNELSRNPFSLLLLLLLFINRVVLVCVCVVVVVFSFFCSFLDGIQLKSSEKQCTHTNTANKTSKSSRREDISSIASVTINLVSFFCCCSE